MGETPATYVASMGDLRTIGVEEELHVVDLRTGRLSAKASQLLRGLPDVGFSAELQRTTDDALQLCVVRPRAHRPAQIRLVQREQARAQPAVGGQPDPVAVAAEGL